MTADTYPELVPRVVPQVRYKAEGFLQRVCVRDPVLAPHRQLCHGGDVVVLWGHIPPNLKPVPDKAKRVRECVGGGGGGGGDA